MLFRYGLLVTLGFDLISKPSVLYVIGNGSMWLVVIPSVRGTKTVLTLANRTVGHMMEACDLVSARPVTLAGSSFSAVLRSTVVLHIASGAASGVGCGAPLGEHVWWPKR